MNSDMVHAGTVMEWTQDTKRVLEEAGYVNLRKLMSVDTDELLVEGANPADMNVVNDFLIWYASYLQDPSRASFQEAFSQDVWDTYVPPRFRMETLKQQSQPTPSVAASDDASEESGATTRTKVKILANLDPSKAPKFNGKPEKWPKARRLLRAVLTPHKLYYVVDQFEKPPIESDGERYKKFLEDRSIVHAVLTHSTADGAASIVKKHDRNTNGRQAFLDLDITYWSQGAQDNAATRAMTQIEEARLTRRTKDGAEGYIQTWEDALDDLDEAERPYDPLLRKLKFLDGIEDPTYDHVREILRLDTTKDYDNCVLALRQASIQKSSKWDRRRVQNTNSTSGDKKNKRKKATDTNFRVPSHVWQQLSQDEKKVLRELQKLAKGARKPDTITGQSLPSQYGTAMSVNHAAASAMFPVPPTVQVNHAGTSDNTTVTGPGTQVPTATTTEPTDPVRIAQLAHAMLQQSAASQKGATGPSRQGFNVRSRTVTLHNQNAVNALNFGGETYALDDSGTDTCILSGHQFIKIAETERVADLQAFKDDFVEKQVPICSGATAIDLPSGETIIAEVHEAPFLEDGGTTLLSTFQMREHGVWVDNVAKRHGGNQEICVEDYHIPLEIRNGLLGFQCRKPTSWELENLFHVSLTSEEVWSPSEHTYDGDEGEVIPSWKPTQVNQSSTVESDVIADTIVAVNTYLVLPAVAFFAHRIFGLGTKRSKPEAEKVQNKFGFLPLKTVQKTLEVTTQLAVAVYERFPMRRHFKSRYPQLNRNRLQECFATDTYFGTVKALGGYTSIQLFVGERSNYTVGYALHTESQGPEALEDFLRDVGAPPRMHSDNARMETLGAWGKICRRYNIAQSTTEPHSPQQNPAERRIQEVKKHVNHIMDRVGAPDMLWVLCTLYVIFLLNRTASADLGWSTPYEKIWGVTPDISSLLQFAFYEPVYYHNPDAKHPGTKEELGRFVGVTENVGDAMTYWILQSNDTVVARSVVRSAAHNHEHNQRAGQQGRSDASPKGTVVQSVADTLGLRELPTIDPDDVVGKSLAIDYKGVPRKATILTYEPDENQFRVEYTHGGDELVDYATIMEAYAQHDDGHKFWSFKAILDHRRTKGRNEVKVLWDTGEETWEPMQEMRKFDPLTIANYAHDNHLLEHKGWHWAKRHTRREKKFIRMLRILKTQKKAYAPKYKFGVRVPRNVRDALSIDRANGNTLWAEAIQKELRQLEDFETFEVAKPDFDPGGYTYVPLHMCFDVKFDGRRKARLVAGGNWTDPATEDVYSGVVSIDTVRMALFIAELNDLEVIATDVGNAYLHGKTKEKIYTVAGDEFGPASKGKRIIIRKALYGLKTSAARWHEVLADSLCKIGFHPSKADPDLWVKDCSTHYEYIATYVDDLLVMSKDAMGIIRQLEEVPYPLKGTGVPEYYLGGDITRTDWVGPKGSTMAFGARTYIRNICEKIETLFRDTEVSHLKNYGSPLLEGYHPELDASSCLGDDMAKKYRMLVGCLNWVVTLGRFDVHYAASTMARYSAMPREGHLKQMLRVFGYLKHHQKGKVIVDTAKPTFTNERKIETLDWMQFYPQSTEEIPPDMPKPRGKPVVVTGYFDADHAHCQETRRSVTGIILFLNSTPVKWYCKRQATVESSTYGSELVAGRIAVELVMEIRYKLRMLGVPVEGPAWLFGDNLSMIKSTTIPSSTLKMKHNAIAYHRIREAIASGIVHLQHVNSTENLADILTKPLGHQAHFKLMKPVLFRGVPNQGECQKAGSGDGSSDVYHISDVQQNSDVHRISDACQTSEGDVCKTCGQE